jgi:hypothetical protein
MTQERIALKGRLSELRPRRLPLMAAALALAVAAVAGYVFVVTEAPPQGRDAPAGEPLKLKLDYRLTSARTPG